MILKKPARKKAKAQNRQAAPAASPAHVSRKKLPEAYGTKHLFLVARDPHWLYAHWDFTRTQQHELNQLSGDGHLALRVYEEASEAHLIRQIGIEPYSRHSFVPVGKAETGYIAELGYRARAGEWVTISRSNLVVTPPDTIAPDTSLTLATVSMNVPLSKVIQTVKKESSQTFPLVEAFRFLGETGHLGLPENYMSAGEHEWTPEQARELDKLTESRLVPVRGLEEMASLTAAGILPEAEHGGTESPPTSPGDGWSGDLL